MLRFVKHFWMPGSLCKYNLLNNSEGEIKKQAPPVKLIAYNASHYWQDLEIQLNQKQDEKITNNIHVVCVEGGYWDLRTGGTIGVTMVKWGQNLTWVHFIPVETLRLISALSHSWETSQCRRVCMKSRANVTTYDLRIMSTYHASNSALWGITEMVEDQSFPFLCW